MLEIYVTASEVPRKEIFTFLWNLISLSKQFCYRQFCSFVLIFGLVCYYRIIVVCWRYLFCLLVLTLSLYCSCFYVSVLILNQNIFFGMYCARLLCNLSIFEMFMICCITSCGTTSMERFRCTFLFASYYVTHIITRKQLCKHILLIRILSWCFSLIHQFVNIKCVYLRNIEFYTGGGQDKEISDTRG